MQIHIVLLFLFPEPPEKETRECNNEKDNPHRAGCGEAYDREEKRNDRDHEHDLATDPEQHRRSRLLMRGGVMSCARSLATTRGHVRDPGAGDPDCASLSPRGAHAGAEAFPTYRDTR